MLDNNLPDLHARTLLRRQIIHGIRSQHDPKVRTRVLQCATQPQDRVVLLFQRRAISSFDDVQNPHKNLLAHLVGITSVLVYSLAILKKSAGLPCLTPSTTFAAPRSSTHNPQLTQVSSGL